MDVHTTTLFPLSDDASDSAAAVKLSSHLISVPVYLPGLNMQWYHLYVQDSTETNEKEPTNTNLLYPSSYTNGINAGQGSFIGVDTFCRL